MKEDFEEIFAYQDDRKATVDVREAAEILGLSQHRVQIHPLPAASGSAHRTPLADRQRGALPLCVRQRVSRNPTTLKGILFL